MKSNGKKGIKIITIADLGHKNLWERKREIGEKGHIIYNVVAIWAHDNAVWTLETINFGGGVRKKQQQKTVFRNFDENEKRMVSSIKSNNKLEECRRFGTLTFKANNNNESRSDNNNNKGVFEPSGKLRHIVETRRRKNVRSVNCSYTLTHTYRRSRVHTLHTLLPSAFVHLFCYDVANLIVG